MDEMEVENVLLIPPHLWTVDSLKMPEILKTAFRTNPERVGEVFSSLLSSQQRPQSTQTPKRAKIPDPDVFIGASRDLSPLLDALAIKFQGDTGLFPGEQSKIPFGYALLAPI